MNLRPKKKIVLLGMMSRHPVAGMVWLTMQYLIGFERLGHEVFYVERYGTPAFIDSVLRRFDLGHRWVVHDDEGCHGLSGDEARRLYDSVALIINLHGGTKPLPEHVATGRLVYLETDPVELEIDLYDGASGSMAFVAKHNAFFTWAENYGHPDCRVPLPDGFQFRPTRQPVVVDLWESRGVAGGERFTTIGNWRQLYREVAFQGEVYHWSKHYEFLKFIGLPSRTGQAFELALASYDEADRQMLESKGWKVRPAATLSTDVDAYRDYVCGSRGEFTVAKDQYSRMRTGWFSDRSASYLAAGRPVVTQETGFSNVLPTGQGLFAFSSLEEIVDAVDSINSAYEKHCRAAREIALEYFSYDVVLPRLLAEAGV